ncbi:tail protein X [Halocynthiibacter namhaensis]|uniref:tail protein X n=1 Tax=Halocynthiibacter namhaensis TaxID=1290553 RepID=UPI0005792598|nr:tail protein X [Halocynthiibacter namhaensis]
MSSTYITKENDALDLICARHYGRQAGAVERVLEANPDITPIAHRPPAGVRITLPDVVLSKSKGAVKLWD